MVNTCGVPQDINLGPPLVILYINDICNFPNLFMFVPFANDSNLFFTHKNPNTLVRTLNSVLQNIIQCIRANELLLNLQKAKYMIFSNTFETLNSDIILDNNLSENISHIKFLEIIVENILSWKPHINTLCKTVSRNIGVIHRLKSYIPESSLLS